ncbi:MAG: hypothetical protein C0448_15645 [Sphingobacteriaceae bacterium]|nr:hypothetical protein [Sphingobacteriaceae bacterium]
MNSFVKISRIVTIFLLLFTGVNAIVAGILFVIDPSGKKIGMSTSYLSHSPFSTFLIPGLTLLVVNGLLNIIASIICIKKHKHYPVFIIVQGLLLSGWIIIQVMMVKDFNLLHFVMLSIGLLLIANGLFLKFYLKVSPQKK